MGQSTVKAQRRAAAKKEPVGEEVVQTEVVEEEEGPKVWAKKGSLAAKAYEDVQLPMLGEWVRIRYMNTPEIARLQFLPDLADSAEMIVKLQKELMAQAEEEGKEFDDETAAARLQHSSEYIVATIDYMTGVAHVAVIDPEEPQVPRKCEECDMRHIPSLWSREQCSLLAQPDLEVISNIALRAHSMKVVRPFSTDETSSDSETPVSTGE